MLFVTYIILASCSNTCSYLKNIKNGSNVCDYMEKIFYQPGTLNLFAECYHYIWVYTGRSYHRRKIVSYSEFRTFPYLSWRDTSGTFDLDTSGVSSNSKELLKLHLLKSVEMLNDGTVDDYNYFRDCLVFRLQYIDDCFNLVESTSIPGFEENTLVQMATEIPCMASVGCYAMSIICFFGEFYKLCFNGHCSFQEFTIRKLISARGNVNQIQQYMTEAPKIVLRGQTTEFSDISKYIPAPLADTPEDQRRSGPTAPTNKPQTQDPKDIERNFNVMSAPVHANSTGANQNVLNEGIYSMQQAQNMQQGNPNMQLQYGNPNPSQNINNQYANPNLQYQYQHANNNNQQMNYNPNNNLNVNAQYGYNVNPGVSLQEEGMFATPNRINVNSTINIELEKK